MALGAGLASAACHNCGARLHGRFCASCGQEDRPLDPTLEEVVRDAAREISSLDGRIVRSVRRLFLSPGYLTREFFAGRRMSWVSPVRLYLTFSVAYFALAALTGSSPLSINARFSGADEQGIRQIQQAVDQALATWIPRAMFLLVPVFAALVAWVRRSARCKYPHHLVFALHVFAAFFGAQAAAIALGSLADRSVVTAGFGAATLVYAFAYLAAALRLVYAGTLRRAIRDAVVLLVLHWLATVLVTAAILLPVVAWRL